MSLDSPSSKITHCRESCGSRSPQNAERRTRANPTMGTRRTPKSPSVVGPACCLLHVAWSSQAFTLSSIIVASLADPVVRKTPSDAHAQTQRWGRGARRNVACCVLLVACCLLLVACCLLLVAGKPWFQWVMERYKVFAAASKLTLCCYLICLLLFLLFSIFIFIFYLFMTLH